VRQRPKRIDFRGCANPDLLAGEGFSLNDKRIQTLYPIPCRERLKPKAKLSSVGEGSRNELKSFFIATFL